MSSAFERLQKVAEEKRKAKLEVVETKEQVLEPTPTKQYQPPPSSTNPSQVVPTLTNMEPVSPIRNFTKVANSITNDAIPKGLFKGLSKHTYDVLYKLTRGAIKPNRFVQITQRELMRLTGLSENTLRSHIKYLHVTRLIIDTPQMGKHEGTIYEVFLPEEVPLPSSTNPSQVVPTSHKEYQQVESSRGEYQTLVPYTSQDLALLGTTKTIENKDTSARPNTLHNTIKNDDERALAILIEKLAKAVKKLTGRNLKPNEAEKWGELADILILQLEVAAARAENPISSVPAFLTEVMRRQFFAARPQKSSGKPTKTKKDTVGKSDLPEEESYEIKPLDEQGREAALIQLQEFANDEFLKDFEKWYTAEDWTWLTKQLNSEK